MVNNHYRWDFIGLSTDEKPTSETSEKVVNGSTFYCSDTSKLYVYCDGTWYERKPLGGGGGGGTSDFDELENRPKYNGTTMTGETDIPEVKTYTAGTNVSISEQGAISATDTTYTHFTGATASTDGIQGLVPGPLAGDEDKYLKGDGTWGTVQAGPTVVQTTGTSTTDVMSQNAVTSMVYADPSTKQTIKMTNGSAANGSVAIGYDAYSGSGSSGVYSVAIGQQANTYGAANSVALGSGARVRAEAAISIGYNAGHNGDSNHKAGQIMLGAWSSATRQGEMNIGTSYTEYGFNSSNYRLISGVYDGQSAHDAVTVEQVNSTIDAINTALSTNIPHIGA